MKNATFFGGAMNITDTKEYKDSILIGEYFSSYGYTIKNGGYRGLMEAVSIGASRNGGKVHGFTCQTFGYTKGNKYLTTNTVCIDIYDRLKLLIEDSEVYIVQRGGIGTLSELFLLLDGVRKQKVKPLIFVFGDELKNLFSNLGDFIPPKQISSVIFCKDFEDFLDRMVFDK